MPNRIRYRIVINKYLEPFWNELRKYSNRFDRIAGVFGCYMRIYLESHLQTSMAGKVLGHARVPHFLCHHTVADDGDE